jgi:hypothetical protein
MKNKTFGDVMSYSLAEFQRKRRKCRFSFTKPVGVTYDAIICMIANIFVTTTKRNSDKRDRIRFI